MVSLDLIKEEKMKEDLEICLKMSSIYHQLTFLILQIQNKCICLIYKWTSQFQRKCRKRCEILRKRKESMIENWKNIMNDKVHDIVVDKVNLQLLLKQFLIKREFNTKRNQILLLCQKSKITKEFNFKRTCLEQIWTLMIFKMILWDQVS